MTTSECNVPGVIASPESLSALSQASVSAQRAYIQESIQGYRDVIGEYENTISQLQSHWNQLTPISRLRAEILTAIFAMHVAEHRNHATMWHPRHWIAFTHVCRHWRALALDVPTLWTSINFEAEPSCISDMLARTKQATLNVKVDFGSKMTQYKDKHRILQKLLAEDMPRIRELCLIRWRPIETCGSARSLRRLQLASAQSQQLIQFSGMLFGDEAPMLEYLSIRVTSPTLLTKLSQAHHPNLREVSLSASAASLHDIRAILHGMPLLEALKFEPVPRNVIPGDRLITLPNLHRITLLSTISCCTNFLTAFILPSIKTITITKKFFLREAEDLRTAQVMQFFGLRDASLKWIPSVNPFTFRLATRSKVNDPSTTSLEISVWSEVAADSLALDLQHIYKILPISDIETFTLISECPVPTIELWSLFDQMPRLHVLRARQCSLFSILKILFSHDASALGGNIRSNFDFATQHLEVLELSQVNCGSDQLPKLRGLRIIVAHGRRNGFKPRFEIKKVICKGCTDLDSQTIALLQKIAGVADSNFEVRVGTEIE